MNKHNNIIDTLGGTVSVAKICGVTSQAVSQMRRLGIPSKHFAKIVSAAATQGIALTYDDLFGASQ
jgi:hypothetical protein